MVGSKKKRKKKTAARRSKKPATPWRLKPLVEFLNRDLSKGEEPVSGELNLIIYRDMQQGRLENLKPLQDELIRDLSPIAKHPQGGQKRFNLSSRLEAEKKMQNHLDSLAQKINAQRFEVRLVVLSGEKEVLGMPNPTRALLNREQGIFSWHAGKWIVKTDFSAGMHVPKRHFYAIIAEGLLTGELARLRRCGYCQTFFVAQQPRFTFCPGHARLFYDRPAKRKESHGNQ